MKQVINETIPFMDNYNDPRIGGEYLKLKMREYASDIAIKNAKQRKKTRVDLEKNCPSWQ